MIDSLFLDFGHEFEVSDDSLLVVQRDTTACYGKFGVREHGLWTNNHSGVVSGRRAYFRRTDIGKFDIDIKVWRDGKRHCLVKFSVPELLHGTNGRPAAIERLPSALEALGTGMARVGIQVDPRQARIVRIDLARQEDMVAPFSAYARVLRRIHVPSTDLQERDSTILYLHRQGGWAINAYDKAAHIGANLGAHFGTLRLELQLRTPRIVERTLGYSSVADLLEFAPGLADVYRDFLNARLRIQSFLEDAVFSGNDVGRIEGLVAAFRQRGGERWRAELLERLGLAFMCRELGVENTASVLSPVGRGSSSTERSRHSRILKKARAAIMYLDRQIPEGNESDSDRVHVLASIQQLIDGRIV